MSRMPAGTVGWILVDSATRRLYWAGAGRKDSAGQPAPPLRPLSGGLALPLPWWGTRQEAQEAAAALARALGVYLRPARLSAP